MAFGDSDLDVFLADFGEDVAFGASTVKGVVDEHDDHAPLADGSIEGVVHTTTLMIKASDWPDVDDGDLVTVRGQSYMVDGTPLKQHDGAFKQVSLVAVGP